MTYKLPPIQNKISHVTNKQPQTLLEGELAFNSADGKLFFGGLNGNIVTIDSNPNFYGSTLPASASLGSLGYLTTDGSVSIFTIGGWVPAVTAMVSSSQPVGLKVGQLWFHSIEQQLYVYSGVSWIKSAGSSVARFPINNSQTTISSTSVGVSNLTLQMIAAQSASPFVVNDSNNSSIWEVSSSGTLLSGDIDCGTF
jgi:hypothetical protein